MTKLENVRVVAQRVATNAARLDWITFRRRTKQEQLSSIWGLNFFCYIYTIMEKDLPPHLTSLIENYVLFKPQSNITVYLKTTSTIVIFDLYRTTT